MGFLMSDFFRDLLMLAAAVSVILGATIGLPALF